MIAPHPRQSFTPPRHDTIELEGSNQSHGLETWDPCESPPPTPVTSPARGLDRRPRANPLSKEPDALLRGAGAGEPLEVC